MLMFNADELFERLGLTVRCEDCEHRNKYCGDVRCENGTWSQVCDVLDHMTLIDAEPVVRCKDCRHWCEMQNLTGACLRLCAIDGALWMGTDATDYCSFAERRDDD